MTACAATARRSARAIPIVPIAAMVFLCAAFWPPAAVMSDGGAVCLRASSGAFLVTVFAAPFPLATGTADLSVMVQRRGGGAPILDADVELKLAPPGDAKRPIIAHPTRAQATNKLLYAAAVRLAMAGEWKLTVRVREGARQAVVSGSLPVESNGTPGAIWLYLAPVPLALLVFTLHQFLSRRRRAEAG